ncbi:MAG TPA: metallophosphoesterase [Actinomycetota bacterium]|nr:metallophosphoesterase [Actinomycetota bacterium]
MLKALLGIVAFGVACLLYASLIERNWFALRKHRVPCLPAGARPIRILHISDLHFRRGQRMKHRFLARCAATAPDLVVCTGDFLDEESGIEAAVPAVAQIKPSARAFFVLGSHDYYSSSFGNPLKYFRGPSNRKPPKGHPLPWRDLVAKLEDNGWELILNRSTSVTVDGLGTVDVVGLDDPHINRHDLSVASERSDPGFRLAVVHSPDAAPALAELGYDLIVCGHTHGGQVRMPIFGALVTNSKLPRSAARGVSRLNGSWLHVSAGLGTSRYAPVRFACRPEACLLELTPAEDAVRNGA